MKESSVAWIKGAEDLLANLEKNDQQLIVRKTNRKLWDEIIKYMQSINDKIEKIEEVKEYLLQTFALHGLGKMGQ